MPFSESISTWYSPLFLRYTSKVADGQGKVPIFSPCHEGMMLLSTVMVNNGSSMLSTLKGSIVGKSSAASPSFRFMVMGCPAIM